MSQLLSNVDARPRLAETNNLEILLFTIVGDSEDCESARRKIAQLLDGKMPEMDRFTLTRAIRNDRRFEGIPVAMLSALATDAKHFIGNEFGYDAYVRKFDTALRVGTLRALLSEPGKSH